MSLLDASLFIYDANVCFYLFSIARQELVIDCHTNIPNND